MIRIPISPDRIAPRVRLTEAERHYLLDVLRLRPGSRLEVLDGVAHRYAAEVDEGGYLSLSAPLERPIASAPITIAQALAKGEKMELVIQKATELGAAAIWPFRSMRTVVHLDGGRASDRVDRWQRIAAAAAAQCGRVDIPQIRPITPFSRLLLEAEGRLVLLYENEKGLRLSSAVAAAEGLPITLLIGPEGGFAPEEIVQAQEAGASIATLGERILRTETVALAALAVIHHLRGELG